MDYLEKLRLWVMSAPMLAGFAATVDALPPREGVSVEPKGRTLLWQKTDVLGNVRRRWREVFRIRVRRNAASGMDNGEAAAVWRQFALWAGENPPPALGGDFTSYLESAALHSADGNGTAVYTAGLTLEYTDSHMGEESPRLAHYLHLQGKLYRLGLGMESLSIRLGPLTEKVRDILGITHVHVLGYERTLEMQCTPEDALYPVLYSLVEENTALDGVNACLVEAKLGQIGENGWCPAARQAAVMELTQSGAVIVLTLHCTGRREKGLFDPAREIFTVS